MELEGQTVSPANHFSEFLPNEGSITLTHGKSEDISNITLKEIQNPATRPGIFRVVGHVTDFFPLSLEECAVLMCMTCNTELVYEFN